MKISPENFSRIFFALMLLLGSLFIASCSNQNTDSGNNSGTANSANQSPNQSNLPPGVKDDIAELNALINFPEPPEEVLWREDNVSGKGKRLIAVLKYDTEDFSKVTAAAEKHNPPTTVEIGAEEWFPEDLTAPSQLSGTKNLKGNAFAANDFLNQPYNQGRLIRIDETNYLILELTTF